ncbi:MAG: family 4 glycosyl hydrolase [Planctomycetota bacterium]|jgi:alpha-galactosidase
MAKSVRKATEIKIAYIGGGSRGWAHTLMNDLALCPHLAGRVALYDIDPSMARLNARWGRRVNAAPRAKSQWRYTVAKTLPAALKGADFVVASIQPGPIEMMGCDLEIPKKYGILHPVGDTAGPAGIVRALRSVGEYAKIAEAVARHCPDAWVINYTNPMTACTRALFAVFPDIKAMGCCHEVFGTQSMLAGLVEKYHGHRPPRRDVRVNVLGVNHFTWIDRAEYQGLDLLKLYARHIRSRGMVRRIPPAESAEMDYFEHRGQVTADLFRRYGILPAAGERHIVEFLPFYLRDEQTLNRWGVKATPYSYRIERYQDLPARFRKRLTDKTPFKLNRSGEEGVGQMMALLGMGNLHTNVNLPNVGQLEHLPRGAVVETNAFFTQDSIKPEFSGHLPPGVEAWVSRAVSNQEITVEAALKRDKHLAFQAVLNDPLTDLTTDRAWKMFNEMLRATRAMLPGWKI